MTFFLCTRKRVFPLPLSLSRLNGYRVIYSVDFTHLEIEYGKLSQAVVAMSSGRVDAAVEIEVCLF